MKLYSLLITILFILFSNVALAERISVSVSAANVHSGPGKNYDILWKVEKYHPLFILEKSDSWYHFRDFEGDEGWGSSTRQRQQINPSPRLQISPW